jgi:nucleoside-diphosphate-sugar epimerase
MESPQAQNEDFNLGSAKCISIRDVAERIWRKVHGPDRPFRFAPQSAHRYDFPYRVPDVRKAREILGFDAAITLDEMLDEVIAWIREAMDAGMLKSTTIA